MKGQAARPLCTSRAVSVGMVGQSLGEQFDGGDGNGRHGDDGADVPFDNPQFGGPDFGAHFRQNPVFRGCDGRPHFLAGDHIAHHDGELAKDACELAEPFIGGGSHCRAAGLGLLAAL